VKVLNENRPGFKRTRAGYIPTEWEVVNLSKVADVIFSNVDKNLIAMKTLYFFATTWMFTKTNE
jgi:hypothetical protein